MFFSIACLIGLVAASDAVPEYRWVKVTMEASFAPRDGAGALVYRDKMWLIGGWNPRDEAYFPRDCVNDVWSSVDGLNWTLERANTFGTPAFDPAREWEGRHTAGYVVFRDKMWIVGGDPLQGHYQSDVWNSADGRDWTCVNADRPVPWGPRVLHYTLAFQDKIWVMGGQTTPQYAPAGERFYDDIWNSEDGVTWTQVVPNGPHWPQRGMIGGAVVLNGRIWILGGGTYDTPNAPQRKFYNDVWSSADGVQWTQHLASAPWTPRQYHDVAAFDGRLWVMEGWNQENRNDVWHSADGVNWHEVPDTPWKPRHAASVFVYNNALWMVAGNNMEPDVWKLERAGAMDKPLIHATASVPESKTIAEVLRQPLPPEELTCTAKDGAFVIEGPTFRYIVDAKTGLVAGLEAEREGRVVATMQDGVKLWIDDTCLTAGDGKTEVAAQQNDQIILLTQGALTPGLDYSIRSTFYSDGVAVSAITLTPQADFSLRRGIRHEVRATGRFSQWLHKRRDTNGMDCLKGALPAAGETVPLFTLTSCLEVFSADAALAIFTDRGGTHRSSAELETASLRVDESTGADASVVLAQHLVNVAPGAAPYVLHAGEPFTFRIGYAVAPNRLPHPRWRDLRMFIWVGDEGNPYPTDEEIHVAARLGFTLFQMHRLGTPGEPRPPAGELDRVLRTVHDAGMLFIWTANADLMYASAPKVAELRAANQWTQWQGFNYGGQYTARMDPYCTLASTCLASPNGLADYRVACLSRMLERYDVDGMYIDDNLAYANCTLWKEHGHPEPVYDCLIELHDMNWRRRQTLRASCSHAVLIDHCTRGFALPVVSAFDGHLFGEGYSFPSIEAYWDTFGSFRNMWAAGSLFAGDSEKTRCGAEIAYAFDLLTGGGQYCYLDWRLWPEKFPYAAGVSPYEALFVKTYNLAQYYFGMYESEPYLFGQHADDFSASAPGTYATIYRNELYGDMLVVLANMNKEAVATSLVFKRNALPLLNSQRPVSLYDVNRRTVTVSPGTEVLRHLADISLGPSQMKLFQLRAVPEGAVYHQWGGKRIAEVWDAAARKLVLRLDGPEGLEDTVVLGAGGNARFHARVNGAPADFGFDADSNVLHGTVTFGREPLTVEVTCDGALPTPLRRLTADELTTKYIEK